MAEPGQQVPVRLLSNVQQQITFQMIKNYKIHSNGKLENKNKYLNTVNLG